MTWPFFVLFLSPGSPSEVSFDIHPAIFVERWTVANGHNDEGWKTCHQGRSHDSKLLHDLTALGSNWKERL